MHTYVLLFDLRGIERYSAIIVYYFRYDFFVNDSIS